MQITRADIKEMRSMDLRRYHRRGISDPRPRRWSTPASDGFPRVHVGAVGSSGGEAYASVEGFAPHVSITRNFPTVAEAIRAIPAMLAIHRMLAQETLEFPGDADAMVRDSLGLPSPELGAST